MTKRFTFREELVETHWLFSRATKDRFARNMRHLMLSAIPFAFDDTMSEEIIQLAYRITQTNEYDVQREAGHEASIPLYTVSIPREITITNHWHFPAGICWIEWQSSDNQMGILYFYSPGADSPIIDPTRNARFNLTPEEQSQQGCYLFFMKKKGNPRIMTALGNCAFGAAVHKLGKVGEIDRATLAGVNYPLHLACAKQIDRISDIESCLRYLSAEMPVSRRQQYEMQLFGMWSIYPVIWALNSARTVCVQHQFSNARPSGQMIGNSFVLSDAKLVTIKCGLRDIIRLSRHQEAEIGRRKGQEFVRGYHRKYKDGKLLPQMEWKWIDAYFRGDPSLGMSKRAYEYQKDKG